MRQSRKTTVRPRTGRTLARASAAVLFSVILGASGPPSRAAWRWFPRRWFPRGRFPRRWFPCWATCRRVSRRRLSCRKISRWFLSRVLSRVRTRLGVRTGVSMELGLLPALRWLLRRCRALCRGAELVLLLQPGRLLSLCDAVLRTVAGRAGELSRDHWSLAPMGNQKILGKALAFRGGTAYLSGSRRTRTCLWPMVVMQRRNASFLVVRPRGRSREGGRYGCYPTEGRGALP